MSIPIKVYSDLQIHADLQLNRKLIMGCANLSVEHDDQKNHVAITLANTTSGTAINFLKITGADSDGSLNIYCPDTTNLIDNDNRSVVSLDRANRMLTINYQVTFKVQTKFTAFNEFTGIARCTNQLQCHNRIMISDELASDNKELIGSIRGVYDTSNSNKRLELSVNQSPPGTPSDPKLQLFSAGPCWQYPSGSSNNMPIVHTSLDTLQYSRVGDIFALDGVQPFSVPSDQGWIMIYQIGNNDWHYGRLASSDQTVSAIGVRLW